MVLADLFNEAAPLSRLWELLKQPILVVLCPALHRQLRNLQPHAALLLGHTQRFKLPRRTFNGPDVSLEATVPRCHCHRRVPTQHQAEIGNQVARVVIRNTGRPAGANTIGAIHQDHWDDRTEETRFDLMSFLKEMLQYCIVIFRKDAARHLREAREDVSRCRMVLPPLQARAELPTRLEEVHIVASDKVLGHADDRALQGCFAMMIGALLGHVS
mmetsp:Transcript_29243/g.47301  ORF Transcript_29243/g.47301 Transcript_29243/m.47301 type:complete len:215 (-) Transcript_29243:779-1423(-)